MTDPPLTDDSEHVTDPSSGDGEKRQSSPLRNIVELVLTVAVAIGIALLVQALDRKSVV